MSDPLSVTGSVVGIISLGLQVTQSLYNYYAAIDTQYSDVTHTARKLESLLEILNCLQTHLDGRKVEVDGTHVLDNIESTIKQCEECIQELQEESRKFEREPVDGIRTAIRATGRRLAYPFRESTLKKLDEDIDELVIHLSLALQLLQQDVTNRIQDEIEDTRAVLDLVRASQLSSEIQIWLKAPDASIDFNDACKKKNPGTGLWFIKSPFFISWLERPRSFLWLKGFAGCGKSVLCSTAIQHVFRHRRSNPKVGIAFFSFTFADEGKQDTSAMIRALLLQLSSQLGVTNTALAQLYERYRTVTPSDQAFLECLRQLVRGFLDIYIVIDALDESPREKHRDAMLQALNDIRAWPEPGLHILVTSRDEVDIRDALGAMPEEVVVMKNDGIDKDIASFVSQRLRDNRRLQKWQKHYDRIEQVLIEKANGVQALASCLRSEYHLEQLLQSLPRTLDETYERMLRNIPMESKEYARQMLAILCCAVRPLTVPELIDAMAVEVGAATASFDAKRKLEGVDDFQQLCPGFTEIDGHRDLETVSVRIAHFSVQEYLESERIRTQKEASFFSVQRRESNELMAITCLTLLLEPKVSTMEPSLVRGQYPFAKYAAQHWHHHYQGCAQEGLAESQAKRLFLEGPAFQAWITIQYGGDVYGRKRNGETPNPLYYASLLGLYSTLRALLKENKRHGSPTVEDKSLSCNLDTVGGNWGTAIAGAASRGHQHIVQLLLDNDADVNADGNGWTALRIGSFMGHKEVVQLLLENGADATIADQFRWTPMHKALAKGHIKVVKLLLENGADVNAANRDGQTSLHFASVRGYTEVVKLLLKYRADATIADQFR
ncbi:uncharacterized protein LY79DRAFT_593711 [Colletotrichum navitas]|uniref:NACHT domain-containing protein n=1 Tax=Colletotrichum navitas TaxID=681940 RepID=A0AAD8PPH6_9PEZI|nr:uncharacterized protein LY79DRAFT_593711 [Colletotrichum navitas]KAK1573827.1 hypothetical protein LY79DRAFT_593711 [Colletotrichum navitas]